MNSSHSKLSGHRRKSTNKEDEDDADDVCKEQPEAVQEECVTEVQVVSTMEIGEQEDLPPCISISSQSTNKDDDEDDADGVCKEQPEAVQEECVTEVQVVSTMEIDEQEDLPPCISISSQSTNKEDEDDADGVCKEQPEAVQEECVTELQVVSTMEIGEQEDLPPCISISSQNTNKDDKDDADGVCTETVEDDVTTTMSMHVAQGGPILLLIWIWGHGFHIPLCKVRKINSSV
ncbi:hypothetical protein J6590_074030 [Homalodisca vitripennis]|nr:hypothetical protein J6590_074030 [Homalodisca vitripennis]